MDPYEQRLRNEVIYLHSLWHQGPPSTNPNPNLYISHNISRHLQPSISAQFKKERKTPRGRRGRIGKKSAPEYDPPPVSGSEWPCPPVVETLSATTSGWPSLKLPSAPTTRLPSAEELARIAANQVHQKALKAVQEFFVSNADSDGDCSDEEGDDEGDSMDEDVCEEYKFFLKLFMEDNELRGYCEKKYENGEFCCLVCGGVGKKVWKRFKDCVALVQHSIAIANTKKKRAHRAYGQAICKILGWDINRLPTIVLSLGDPLDGALNKSGELQGNADNGGKDYLNDSKNNVDSSNVDNGEAVPEKECNANGDLPGRTDKVPNVVDGELMACESSSMVADASKSMEDLDKGASNLVEGNAEGVVNHLCRNLSRRMVLEVSEMK